MKLNKDKLKKKYKNELNQIKFQKLMKQIKTEEYFIPNLYTTSLEKNDGIINQSHFNISKRVNVGKKQKQVSLENYFLKKIYSPEV